MQHYISTSICIAILALTGCLEGFSARTGVRTRDIVFPLICMAVFSSFRIKPVAEFDLDAATLMLPLSLFALSAGRNIHASRSLRALASVTLLPWVACALYAFYCYLSASYAAFVLRAENICFFQLALALLAGALMCIAEPSKQMQ